MLEVIVQGCKMSYQSTILGLFSIAVLLLIPPMAWHTQSKNVPAMILIIWLLVMDISFIVSAAIWSGDDFMTRWDGKGWCDIVTKLQVGASVGISCAVSSIAYNLHAVLKADSVLLEATSCRKICRDLAMCLVPPVVVMGLSYFAQTYRFGIARYNGCINLMSPTWATTVFYTMWPFLASLVGAVYASMVLFIFFKKRKDVGDILHCTNSRLNLTRFARLLIFCSVVILIMLPLSIYGVVGDVKHYNGHYSFKETHLKALWNIIPKYDAGKTLATLWLYLAMSYLVFFIFGLGADALHMYANFLRYIKLGFIVDFINNSIQKNKEGKINKLLGKISTSEFSSDSSGEKTSGYYTSTTPQSKANFVLDYKTPYDTKRNERRRERKLFGRSKVRNLYTPEEENTDVVNKFMPFFSEQTVDEDSVSLDGLSQLSLSKTNGLQCDLERNDGLAEYNPHAFETQSSLDDSKTDTYTLSPISNR